jgi:hypothetical protein
LVKRVAREKENTEKRLKVEKGKEAEQKKRKSLKLTEMPD